MQIEKSKIDGVLLITPKKIQDTRGHFWISYHKETMAEAGIQEEFIQTNQSFSKAKVLRGLHLQLPPFAQAKLVHVIQGEIYDVALDLRSKSATFGQHVGFRLSSDNQQMLFIPKGFGHGFQVMSETALVQYQVAGAYAPQLERGICWDDPDLNIAWPFKNDFILAPKDENFPTFKQYATTKDAELF